MTADVIAGRFVLCDPLASGSTGTVWRAWDLRERRYCAAKVLRQRDSGDLVRFTREQSVRLAHPHILTPYAWVAEDAHVLIASELVTGGSAVTLLGDWGPLPTDVVADVLDQLLDALAHVHEVGLVHRDVKLGNILFDAQPGRLRARLADFGIAVRASDARLTQHGMVIGTPGYLAPEARAGATPHPAQDLYAAGHCALALLSGVEVTDRDAQVGTSGVPGRLGDVISALLEPDPLRRPASADQARALLRADPVPIPRTRSGEPIVVVDQLPPLPPSWGSDGPMDARSGQAAGTGPEVRRTRAPVSGRPPVGRTGIASRRRTVIAGGGAAALLAASGIWLAATTRGGSGGSGSRSTSGGATSAGPPLSTPTASSAQGPVVRPTPTHAGALCTWQQEGDEVVGSGGTLRCTRNGSAFSWTRV